MAPAKRKSKKGFAIKFDLSLPGLLGVAVVCFCIFLWMFLLGVWSGQTMFPTGKYQKKAGIAEPRSEPLRTVAKKQVPPAGAAKAVDAPVAAPEKKELSGSKKKIVAPKNETQPESEEDPAFFAVQVGAFKDPKLAGKEIEIWKGKGYNPFSRPPEGPDDSFTRVYVGRFDSLKDARAKATAIDKEEKIKPFVVLVPGE